MGLTEVPVTFRTKLTKMSDTVETTTPTVEEVQTPEVATNGEAEAAPAETAPEVTNGATEEPSSNGTTEEATNGTTEAESTNGTTETSEAAPEESSTNGEAAETNEATKRKADTPADDETIEKIAKLKEAAAEVVAEAEKDLPSEPLTEAEATA